MKKVTVLMMCMLGLVVLSSCSSKQKPGEVAKANHEKLMNRDYNGYVETIFVDQYQMPANATREQREQYMRTMNQQNAQIIRTHAEQAIQAKGGIKDVSVKSQKVSSDGKTAQVVLTNTYKNGDKEDITYAMIYDEPADEWKVQMGPNREIWRTSTRDGQNASFRLMDNRDEMNRNMNMNLNNMNNMSDQEIVNAIENHESDRHVVKVKDGDNKEVQKVINKEDEVVVKEKVNGEKEVTRIPKEGE